MKKFSSACLVRRLIVALVVLLIPLSVCQFAQANIVVNGTRIIYQADQREVSVKLTNEGEHPSLTQIWFDSGDLKSSPKTSNAPFIATPPISRIEAGKAQTIRLMYTQEPLPADKESVFWLNVLDIPPLPKAGKDEEAGNNFMQLALRIRIKIFFRPTKLAGSADSAADNVHWQIKQDPQTHAFVLHADNQSAYHVSLISALFKSDDKTIEASTDMLKPMASSDFALSGLKQMPTNPVELEYISINDFGSPVSHKITLTNSALIQQ